jgi:predicted nucleotidyltransferase
VRGVFIPPVEYILGMSKIEQYQEAGTADRPDLVIYELRKYIALAADANPNILEIVFADDSNILSITDVGRILRSNRHLFLSKKARHTFSGYAMSQLKRIESHRRWLLNPPTTPPKRADFGREATAAIGRKTAELLKKHLMGRVANV